MDFLSGFALLWVSNLLPNDRMMGQCQTHVRLLAFPSLRLTHMDHALVVEPLHLRLFQAQQAR
jgi:hypothetical protein